MVRMNKKNKKGFTLVELIVVMAILAILAAILIPSISGMIRRSNQAVDNATGRNLYMAGAMVGAQSQTVDVTLTSGAAISGTSPGHQIVRDFMGNTAPTFKIASTMRLVVTVAADGAVTITVTASPGGAYTNDKGSFSWS